MAKAKRKTEVKPAQAEVQPIVTPVAAAVTATVAPAANATRRTPMAVTTALVFGAKAGGGRVGHTAAAWDAVAKAVTAAKDKGVAMAELAKLITEEIRKDHPGNGSAMSYLTYWVRRGYLKEIGK